MAEVSISGKDTFQINGVLCTSFADGDVGKVTFPNDLMNVVRGKNGNVMYNEVAAGLLGDCMIRVLRGSIFDLFLQPLLVLQTQDSPSFPLLQGSLVKRVGQGNGSVINDTYKLIGGVFTKPVPVVSNAAGETEQSVAVYEFKFGRVGRQQF